MTDASPNEISMFTNDDFKQAKGRDFTGFRISRIELKNFGTYHGPATKFDIDCAGSVFAGANGSGKSTAFDALKVAFTLSPRLNNAASAEGKNDRSVATYYRGIVGDKEHSTGGVRERTLRSFGDPEHFMGILVAFEDKHGNVLTAVRLLYIDAAQKRSWHYITADQHLSLDRDFPRWETAAKIRTRGNNFGFTAHPNFDIFMGRIAKVMGLRDAAHAQRAFKLQAVAASLQVMGSTSQFVRDYMLPDDSLSTIAEDTIKAIDSHGKARAKIALAEEQAATLDVIGKKFDQLEAEHRKENLIRRAADNVNVVAAYTDLVLERNRLGLMKSNLEEKQGELDAVLAKKAGLDSQVSALEAAIKAANGNKVADLQKELDRHIQTRDRLAGVQNRILEAARLSGLDGASATAAGWLSIQTHLDQEDAIQAAVEERQNEWFAARQSSDTQDSIVRELRAEIQAVEQSGSPISKEMRDARDEIAQATGLNSDDIPFLGELLQVMPKWRDEWELAANRVLGGHATRILVPEARFEAAKDAMEKSDAPAHIRLECMSEARLSDQAASRARIALGQLPKDALAHRIEIRKHEFEVYARTILADNADHKCVASGDYAGTKGKTVTARGSIAHSASSAEKDGRRSSNQRRNFVLGWSVEDRLKALRDDLDGQELTLSRLRQVESEHQAGLALVKSRLENFTFLRREFVAWDEVDTTSLDLDIANLTSELGRIRTSGLQQKMDDLRQCRTELSSIEKQVASLHKDIGSREGQVASKVESIQKAFDNLSRLRQQQEKQMTREEYLDIRTRLATRAKPKDGPGHILTRIFMGAEYLNPSVVYQELSSEYYNAKQTSLRSRNKLGQEAAVLVDGYFTKYDGERGKGLSSNIRENSPEGRRERQAWRARAVDLQQRDLPAAQQEAEQFRENTLRTNVMSLRGKIMGYDDVSRQTIYGVNRVLEQHIYNPSAGTYAQIQLRRSANRNIKMFDELIENALNGHTERSESEQFKLYEEIAAFLKENEGGHRATRWLDIEKLANRFEATIREVRLLEGGTSELVRKIDSAAALSGGEKERFSAFLMGVAVNTAFNAHDEDLRDRCLHTILIDEAFGKSDTATTRAAIAVLQAFNLQVIAATPMAKIRPFEPVADTVYMIARPSNMQTSVSRMQMDNIDFAGDSEDDSDLDGFTLTQEAA